MYSIYTKQGINYSISVPNMIYGREMMFQDNFQIYINLSFLFVFSINSQNSKVSTSFPKRLKVRLPQPSPYFTLIKLKKKTKKTNIQKSMAYSLVLGKTFVLLVP